MPKDSAWRAVHCPSRLYSSSVVAKLTKSVHPKSQFKNLFTPFSHKVQCRVSNTFLFKTSFKEIKKALAPSNKIAKKLPLKMLQTFFFCSSSSTLQQLVLFLNYVLMDSPFNAYGPLNFLMFFHSIQSKFQNYHQKR